MTAVSLGRKGEDGIQAMEAWQSYMKRSEIFAGEWIRYDIIASNAKIC